MKRVPLIIHRNVRVMIVTKGNRYLEGQTMRALVVLRDTATHALCTFSFS